MSSEDALRFLETEIETQIEGFDDSRKFYRRGLFYSTVSTASLSALTTVLIGADKALKLGWLSVVALITSAGVTVIAAWDGFFATVNFGFRRQMLGCNSRNFSRT